MDTHGSLVDLPEAYHWLAPELASLQPPVEKRADCASCPMLKRPDEPDPPRRMVFHPEVRCCTYNPVLYNFQVGRIFRREDHGADKVRERMGELEGVNRFAIRPPMAFFDRVAETPRGGFGVDVERTCPYWAPEGLGCTVWRDRNAICRAWFCQHEQGEKGQRYWHAFRDVLWALQVTLARWLPEVAEREGVHPPEDESEGDWEAWYRWCADRLDRATPEEIRALDTEGLRGTRALLKTRGKALEDTSIPDVLGPAVTAFYDLGDGQVMLEGYSHYSPSIWPQQVFLLFSWMDGTVSWREALAKTEEAAGAALFTEADIREMVRLGVLEARAPEDLVPGARLKGVPAGLVEQTDQEMVVFDWPFEGGPR